MFFCTRCDMMRDSDDGAEELRGELVCASCVEDWPRYPRGHWPIIATPDGKSHRFDPDCPCVGCKTITGAWCAVHQQDCECDEGRYSCALCDEPEPDSRFTYLDEHDAPFVTLFDGVSARVVEAKP
jgi:hypothetical protein